MGTIELQQEIKALLAKLNWSQKRLAREVYFAKYDDEDDAEINRFEEKLKKDLSRKTTKSELLESYLTVITQHRDFEKLDLIMPSYHPSDVLSREMQKEMYGISKQINQLLDENHSQ